MGNMEGMGEMNWGIGGMGAYNICLEGGCRSVPYGCKRLICNVGGGAGASAWWVGLHVFLFVWTIIDVNFSPSNKHVWSNYVFQHRCA